MYHRQIFKLLLSNKVLDEPRQRRLFKPTDLVELFNLNEPIDGEFSESDRLFRESKLTPPVSSGFSLSKIEQMKKLASIISKKISASVKSMRENENANSTCEEKREEQNNNLRCIEAPTTENDEMLVDQSLSSSQNNIQKSPSKCNEDLDTNSDADIERNSNTENENIFKKDNCEQDVRSLNNNSVEKQSKFVLNDDKVTLSAARKKRKKHKRDLHSGKTNVSAMFEGERISCLIGRRLGRSTEREESVSTADDDYVLRKLFAKSSKSIILYLKKYIFIYICIIFIFNLYSIQFDICTINIKY